MCTCQAGYVFENGICVPASQCGCRSPEGVILGGDQN